MKCLASIDATTPEGAAWRAALQALWWHAEPDSGVLGGMPSGAPAVREADTTEEATRLTLMCIGRGAVLAGDVQTLGAVTAASRGVQMDMYAGWLAWMEGDATRAREHARAVLQSNAGAAANADGGAADVEIEATSLCALATASLGELEEAADLAREASRRAKAEAMPQSQYLANVTLARVRRLTGRPHHATRILNALLKVVPNPWHGCIHWELLLCNGGRNSDAPALAEPPNHQLDFRLVQAASHQADLWKSVHAGDRTTFAACRDRLFGEVESLTPFALDVEHAVAAIDATHATDSAHPVYAWATGDVAAPPPHIVGLGTGDEGEASDGVAAFVTADPSRATRRIAAAGAPLVDAHRWEAEGRIGRAETVIAALALAGEAGLSREDLFRTVYGFAYDAVVHRTLFNVLIHRVRGRLEELGELMRDDEQFRLTLVRPLLVPDPRCERPLEDIVLNVLARRGQSSAKDAAAQLNVPLRTAQIAIKSLVEEGALSIRRDGRRVEYRVEDTTFSEPTRH